MKGIVRAIAIMFGTLVMAGVMAVNAGAQCGASRSEEHTSELQSQSNLVCRLLLEKTTWAGRPSIRITTTTSDARRTAIPVHSTVPVMPLVTDPKTPG